MNSCSCLTSFIDNFDNFSTHSLESFRSVLPIKPLSISNSIKHSFEVKPKINFIKKKVLTSNLNCFWCRQFPFSH